MSKQSGPSISSVVAPTDEGIKGAACLPLIEGFLEVRGARKSEEIFDRLKNDDAVVVISYKGYNTYRLK